MALAASPSPQILIPDSWSDAAQSIAAHGLPPPPPIPPVTLVCGPKNSGKSTFSRFLANALLQVHGSVVYLDTDVGQPEFTPPGLLSLHVLRQPFSDLGSMCLRPPIRSFFYGDISSKRDPKLYLNSIFRLYDYFIEKFYKTDDHGKPGGRMLPLVINTPGWVKGVGYELLVEIAKYICPTHVVQIRISVESKNLPSGAFWLDADHEPLSSVIEIYAARRDCFNRSLLVQKQARSMRDIRITAYFQQCVPPDMDVRSSKELAHFLSYIVPYEVPISGIKVKHLHCQVPETETFHSLNATIVGLAVTSDKFTETESWPYQCVGLGIVRGIDISRNVLYIITPVTLGSLENVDLLLQGFIEIPTSLLQVRGCTSPYMSRNVLNKFEPYNDMLVDTQ